MSPLEHRAYLLHLTHYDPRHVLEKDVEIPFSMETVRKVIDVVVASGFNTLFVGVSDGIVYKSHPEFKRHYSQPGESLVEICEYARRQGLEVSAKLNFSQSEINCHNHWMRGPEEEWHTHFDDAYYWQTASECIDEVIELCSPERYFHVGMDEDHNRSYSQYVSALRRLDKMVRDRGLRPISWSDSALDYPSGDIYVEKSKLAEKEIDPSLIRWMWNYWAVPREAAESIIENGHELWCAPGNRDADQIVAFRDLTKEVGGKGIVMTNWNIANKPNEDELLLRLKETGPLFNQ
ncbi:MAG: hypothetical protein ACOC2L_03485 [Candidatus Sumerlaeota bacterium]